MNKDEFGLELGVVVSLTLKMMAPSKSLMNIIQICLTVMYWPFSQMNKGEFGQELMVVSPTSKLMVLGK